MKNRKSKGSSGISEQTRMLSNRIKSNFKAGDKVWFLSKTRNKKVYGDVYKIDKKNIQVKVDDYNIWRVSPNLLNQIKEKGNNHE